MSDKFVFVTSIKFDYSGVKAVHKTLNGAKKECEENAEQALAWHDYPGENYYYCDPVLIEDESLSYSIRELTLKD